MCCVVLQENEPANIVEEVLRARKRKKKPSDTQVELDVENLVQQVSQRGEREHGRTQNIHQQQHSI